MLDRGMTSPWGFIVPKLVKVTAPAWEPNQNIIKHSNIISKYLTYLHDSAISATAKQQRLNELITIYPIQNKKACSMHHRA